MKEGVPENPQVNSAVLFEGQIVSILSLDGRALRMGVPAQLGKRFVCAQEIETTTTKEVADPQTGGTKTIVNKDVRNVSGFVRNTDGGPIYLGCGIEILCVKPSSANESPRCCDIPMTLMKPKVLPSAD